MVNVGTGAAGRVGKRAIQHGEDLLALPCALGFGGCVGLCLPLPRLCARFFSHRQCLSSRLGLGLALHLFSLFLLLLLCALLALLLASQFGARVPPRLQPCALVADGMKEDGRREKIV